MAFLYTQKEFSMKNALKLFTIIALIGLTMAVFTACEQPDGNSTVHVASVTLSETSLTMTVGEEKTLSAIIAPSNATNQNVEWSSGAPSVAEVVNGKVTAKTAGSGTITVTTQDGGKIAACTVTVNAGAGSTVSVTGVTLDKTSISITVGSSETLTATVAPDNATNKTVTWLTSDATKAAVENGVVTAVATGTATITVTTADGNKTAACTVTVSDGTGSTVAVTGVSLNKSSTTIIVGGTETLTATVTPNDATNKNVTWSTSDSTKATVTNGEVTAVAAGTATITVTTADGNKTATCTVTVSATAVDVTGVSLNKSSTSITVGGTEILTATITPSGATNQNVNWSSSNTAVATVNGGTVTAVSAGSATITATTVDGNKTATCSVTVTLPNLSGIFHLNSPSNIFTGMTMIAEYYNGTETVSFQWKKDGVNVGTASTTNPNKFAPTTAGSYTVTVSATGYNSKTSEAVTVTQLASGYEVMYYGVFDEGFIPFLKDSEQEYFDELYSSDIKADTINKTVSKSITFSGYGIWCVMVPKSLGDIKLIGALGEDNALTNPKENVTFNGIEYFLHHGTHSANWDDLMITLKY
jgi:uncharacterized protein YjdB